MHHPDMSMRSMAISATLHCITGCSIGEIFGMLVGTVAGMNNARTILLSTGLSFLCGYLLSSVPLWRHGLSPRRALAVVLAADTLSITVMEIVDNLIMAIVPGAMNAGLLNPLFWITMPVALTAAFYVAVPVNQYLLQRGMGHALVHKYHENH